MVRNREELGLGVKRLGRRYRIRNARLESELESDACAEKIGSRGGGITCSVRIGVLQWS